MSMRRIEKLSGREKEVHVLLCKGLLDREIGELLNISVETVKKHNKNIYTKLEVRNRTEAVLLRGTKK